MAEQRMLDLDMVLNLNLEPMQAPVLRNRFHQKIPDTFLHLLRHNVGNLEELPSNRELLDYRNIL